MDEFPGSPWLIWGILGQKFMHFFIFCAMQKVSWKRHFMSIEKQNTSLSMSNS